jgi:mono/diheme cytochrome c family protein
MQGEVIYLASCIGCHGGSGEGKTGPKLAPEKTQFTSIRGVSIDPISLETFIKTYMPPSAPNSLSLQDSYDLAAYIRSLPSAALGKVAFDASCKGCHADGFQRAALLTKYSSFDGVSSKIETTMPPGNPSLCDASCADNITKYFW